jgi:hypothetical protein
VHCATILVGFLFDTIRYRLPGFLGASFDQTFPIQQFISVSHGIVARTSKALRKASGWDSQWTMDNAPEAVAFGRGEFPDL